MNKKILSGIIILCIGLLASFILALLTGSIMAALKFSITFTGMIILPTLPWILLINMTTLQRFALSVAIGLPSISIPFFIIGVLGGPLTTITYISIPAIIFITGMFALYKNIYITKDILPSSI